MSNANATLLFAFIQAAVKQLDKIDKKRYQTTLSYIQESNDDLESSYQLYKDGHFRNSIVLLAQSVEKISKAVFLHLGIIDEKRALKISHLTPILWVDLINSYIGQLGLIAAGADFEKYDQNGSNILSLVKTSDEVVELSQDEISEFLKFSDEVEKYFFGFIESILPRKKRRAFILSWAKSISRLYYLSVIVYPHYHYGRYQAQRSKEISYNLESPIVIMYPEIKSRLEECITAIVVFTEEAYKRNKSRRKLQ